MPTPPTREQRLVAFLALIVTPELTSGYAITRTRSGLQAITCFTCGMTSHLMGDVLHRYCAQCHLYHDPT